MRNIRLKKGFSIVELLIAVAILGILLAICFGTTIVLIGVQQRSDTARQVQEETRDILSYMRQDIKKSETMTVDTTANTITLTFAAPEPNHIYTFTPFTAPSTGGNIVLNKSGTNYQLNSPNVRIRKIDPIGSSILRADASGYWVNFTNLKIESTKNAKPYNFEIATTMAR